MEKIFIKNRHGFKIAVQIEKPESPSGLAFVMHGLGSSKDFPHILAIARSFRNNNYTTVSFDARNTNGESEGKMEEATISAYYEDLEDVMIWAKTQIWYQEPFCLAGHSLGAFCVARYALKNRSIVKALAPLSLVVSGELLFKAWGEEDLESWRKTGIKEWKSTAKNNLINIVRYDFVGDGLKYDLLPEINKLNLPVLMIAGRLDTSTPVVYQKSFFDKLPGPKEFHIIEKAGHTFSSEKYLKEIEVILNNWLKTLK